MIGDYYYYAVTHCEGEERFFDFDKAAELYVSLKSDGIRYKCKN